MLFNSVQFLLFLPIVVILYFSLPHKYRWILLLLSSYYFYMSWKPEYVILIMASTLIDYIAGLQMGKTDIKAKRKKFLILSLITNLGLLFSFKYFNFFNDSISLLLDQFNIFYNVPSFKLLLPVGISFYTFQTLSYTIDVYRGKRKPEKHLGIFALYVSFFPQLVAGPIERSTRLLPQFYKIIKFDYQRVVSGLQLILWGFFKKVVIADNIAIIVDNVFANPFDFQGIHYIIGTVLFAFQIYCDFSGYSDIAIGTAQILGYDLMRNFNKPYFSKSISEFWKRWHISLSSWFKDYLYIPLGGNRVVKWRWYFNLLVVFLISGLWHGSNWTFIAWGFIHGFYLTFSIITREYREKFVIIIKLNTLPRIHMFIKTITTFILVSFAWIFFRANNISEALYIVNNLFSGLGQCIVNFKDFYFFKLVLSKFDVRPTLLLEIAAAIVFLIFIEIIQGRKDIRYKLSQSSILYRWGFYYLVILWILFFGFFGEQPFIYYQF